MAILAEVPTNGRVLLAHPSSQAAAERHGEREGLDVVLSNRVPSTRVFVADCKHIRRVLAARAGF